MEAELGLSLVAVPNMLLRSLWWRCNASGKGKPMGPRIAASGFLFFCGQDLFTDPSSFVCCTHPVPPFAFPLLGSSPLGIHASSLTPP